MNPPNFSSICAEWIPVSRLEGTVAILQANYAVLHPQITANGIDPARIVGLIAMSLTDPRVNMTPDQIFIGVAKIVERLSDPTILDRLNTLFMIALEPGDFYGNLDKARRFDVEATRAQASDFFVKAFGSRLSGLAYYLVDVFPPEPDFQQQYLGTWVTKPAPPKVGDIAENRYTGVIMKIVTTEARADNRVYATLEDGRHCVLPNPNWIIKPA